MLNIFQARKLLSTCDNINCHSLHISYATVILLYVDILFSFLAPRYLKIVYCEVLHAHKADSVINPTTDFWIETENK